jgi:hypothetical protein
MNLECYISCLFSSYFQYIDGNATILNDENEMVDYHEKATKAFALLCENLKNAQLTHIQYCENVKSIWETLCGVHKSKTVGNKLFF